MRNERTRAALGLVLIFVLAGALPSAPEAAPKTMVLGTAPAGTSSFPYMVGVATIINKAHPDKFALSPQETGGSVTNIRLLDAGKIHLTGFSGMVAADALAGKPPFKRKYNVRALFSMYKQPYFWFGRGASGITSWDRIQGKKIAVGTPGGGTRLVGDLVVEAKGLKGKTRILYLQPSAMIDSLRDGNLDAGFGQIAGNSPVPWVQEVMASLNVNFFGLDEPTIAALIKAKPGLIRLEVPANLLKGSPGFATVGDPLIAGVSAGMDERTAFLLTQTVQENLAALASYSPAAKGAKPEDALKGIPSSVPLHPGATRYYKEKGLMK